MKIALGVEYQGYPFRGWQFQKDLPTVQGHLEAALTKIADHPVKTFCAGRTDAGVNAIEQIVHFETETQRDMRAWTLGVNTHLPETISVKWARIAPSDFHARYSAISRRYYYFIYNNSNRSALHAKSATWFYHELDIAKMQTAAKHLIGELDFSSFRSSECESKTPMRNVTHLKIYRYQKIVVIDIEANAFLHHMVRNIVGVLMEIGAGFKNPEWALEVLLAKDRRKAAETAAPQGLYLAKVNY